MSAKRGWQGSIASKLSIAFILTALLSVMLVGILLVGLLRLASAEVARAELRRHAGVIGGQARFLEREPQETARLLRRSLGLSGFALYRMNPSGELTLVAGAELVPLAELDVDALVSGKIVEGRSDGLVYVARRIRGRTGPVVVLSRRDALPPGFLGHIAGRLALAAAVAMALAAGLALFLARRASHPMKALAGAATQIAQGNFDQRVEVASGDEIGVVARSFNQMAAELGDADRRQREFFLSISHELRTPLTAIQGYAEAIEDGTATGKRQREAASVIVGESRRLARLVSDVLDLARIDARRFEVSLDEVEVEGALKAVRQAFAPKAEEAGVEIAVEAKGGSVTADYDRLIQVLSNLVENALRYTPTGKRILLSAYDADGSSEIKIVDGGVGFEPEDLGRAFERQYLWEKYRGIRDVGTGLGLAITRELVRAMGGSVSARNAPDGGAEFTVRLPLVATQDRLQ